MSSTSLRITKQHHQAVSVAAHQQTTNHLNQQQEMIDSNSESLSPQEMTKHSPQPELAMMTNVNVLDLQKEYIDNNKMYAKDNTVYMYTSSTHEASNLNEGDDDMKDDNCHIQTVSPDDNQIIDEQHIITDNHSEQLLTKLAISDDHILRLVGPNGESQQIISREIINGEHHILTRNENGEHTITRIVSAENHGLLNSSDNAIYDTDSTSSSHQHHLNQHKIITTSPSDSSRLNQHNNHHQEQHSQQTHPEQNPESNQPQTHHIIYATAVNDTNQISATTILEQYDANGGSDSANAHDKVRDVHQNFSRNQSEPISNSVQVHRVQSNGNSTHDDKQHKHQIIYTHHKDDGEIFANNHKVSATISTANTSTTSSMYTTTSDDKAPMDLIYEDGVGKTVIYTTTGDSKALELYAGNDLSMLSEGQVIVQGGLQYSTQQLHGQTVFVVSDSALVNGDISPQIHQR